VPRPERCRRWLPVALFAALSLAYFADVPLTGQVVVGSDSGSDLHQGEREGWSEKLAAMAPAHWDERLGGFPSSDEIRPQYFPLYVISLFTSYQRYLSWRYVFTAFLAGWGMFALARRLRLGRPAATWAGLAYMFAPTFLAFTLAAQ
jgi:hypothetical protein